MAELEKTINELDNLNDKFVALGKRMISIYGVFPFDLYCTAILNRSINLNRGFISLIKDENFLAAAPLVRLNLDSLLRLFAPTLVNYNIDIFANKVMGGKSIRTFVDKDGKKLTDRNIVDQLKLIEGFSWVKHLYDVGNYYVHFSEKHIWSANKLNDKEKGTIKSVIYKNDIFIPEYEKIGATKWMISITNGIDYFINGWIEKKMDYEK